MSSKRSSWEISQAVIFALLMREMRTRFGAYRLGYAWALLEPVIHVAVFVIMFGFIMERTMPGINYPVFLITGIIPWQLFNSMLSRGSKAVAANQGLFGYRQVKPFDAFLARMLLEGLIHICALTVLLFVAAWFGLEFSIKDPLGILMALLLLFLFSFGIALILCVVITQSPELEKLMPIIIRPLYFMSGIFFSIDTVPDQYQSYLLWNPVLHANELCRDALFGKFHSPGGSWEYLFISAIIAMTFGMALYRQNSERLITT